MTHLRYDLSNRYYYCYYYYVITIIIIIIIIIIIVIIILIYIIIISMITMIINRSHVADVSHVWVLLSFQQPTFQTTHTTSMIIQLHM